MRPIRLQADETAEINNAAGSAGPIAHNKKPFMIGWFVAAATFVSTPVSLIILEIFFLPAAANRSMRNIPTNSTTNWMISSAMPISTPEMDT